MIFVGYYAFNFLMQKQMHGRWSNYLLLILSYALYIQYVPWCALVLLWVTVATYLTALIISKQGRQKKQFVGVELYLRSYHWSFSSIIISCRTI